MARQLGHYGLTNFKGSPMRKMISLAPSLALAVLLGACGGGGGGTGSGTTGLGTVTAGDASRYVGTWSSCSSTGTSTSERDTVVITATGASTLAFTDSQTSFSAAGCTGTAGTPTSSTGTVVFTGTTKTVGSSTVDKATITQGTSVNKQIFLVTATTLNTGRQAGDGGTVDADGYPNTLDSQVLTKQ